MTPATEKVLEELFLQDRTKNEVEEILCKFEELYPELTKNIAPGFQWLANRPALIHGVRAIYFRLRYSSDLEVVQLLLSNMTLIETNYYGNIAKVEDWLEIRDAI